MINITPYIAIGILLIVSFSIYLLFFTNKKYIYFISYMSVYQDNTTGFGHMTFESKVKINTKEAMKFVAETIIREREFKNLIILNMIRLKN